MRNTPIVICHLITTLDVGGAELMLARLVKRMDRGRFRNVVVSLVVPGEVGTELRASGHEVIGLDMQRGGPSLNGMLRLSRLLRRERPVILQTWLYHADLLGLVVGRLTGVPVILWNIRSANMNLDAYRRLSRFTFLACRAVSRWPDAVVVNSHAGKAYHEHAGFRPRRWIVVPNGVDTDAFAPNPNARTACRAEVGARPDTLLIGFVARVDPMKDHATFIDAAGIFARAAPEARFVLAGAGATPQNGNLRAMLKRAGIADRTSCLGQRSDVPWVMNALDIATSCSRGEGFPNVVAEAMACGLPSVVTDVGDSARLVGETGLLVPDGRADALVAAWQQLRALGAEGRVALGARARQVVISQYSMTRAVTDYQDLYEAFARGDVQG